MNEDLIKFDNAIKAGKGRTEEQQQDLIEMALGNLHGDSSDVVLARSLNEGNEFMITSVSSSPFTPEGTDREIWTPRFGTDLGGTIACKWFDGVGSTNFDIAKYFSVHANVTKYLVKEKKTETAISRENKPYTKTTYTIVEIAETAEKPAKKVN